MKPARTKATLSEQFAGTPLDGVAASDIHEDEGYIDNVVVCGFKSKNNRTYPRSTFDRDFKKYEGAKVNFDHKPATHQRDFDDMGGWLSHVRQGDDGRPRARLNVYKTDRRAAKVFEAARRNPNSFGLSHMALCETSRGRDGSEVVESIDSVQSVDIVHTPATNAGLMESARSTPAVKTTLKEYVQALAPKLALKSLLKLKRLSEMDDLGAMPVEAPADDDAGDPEDAMWAGFKAAFDAAIDQYGEDKDAAALFATIKKYVKAHQGILDDDDAEDDTETDAEDPVKGESLKPKKGEAAVYEAIGVCESVGLKGFTAAQLRAVVRAYPEDRKVIAESFRKVAESAGGEKPIARTAKSTATESAKPPAKLSWVDAN